MQGLLALALAALLVGCTAVPQQDTGDFKEIDLSELPLPDNDGNRRNFGYGPVFGQSPVTFQEIPATCQCRCEMTGGPSGRPNWRRQHYMNRFF